MHVDAYAAMAAEEDRHWWFVGRRAIVRALIQRRVPIRQDGQAKVLEVGCGTGGNLAMLSAFGMLDALEYCDAARHLAQQRSSVEVKPCALPNELSHACGPYDLIALLDVLEHIDQDVESVRAVSQLLSREGRLIVTVPALPSLWSRHDELHHHKRRYSKRHLRIVLGRAGMDVEYISYFNMLLLPLAIMHRITSRFRPEEVLATQSGIINALFSWVFSMERFLLRHLSLPIGLSLCAICKSKE